MEKVLNDSKSKMHDFWAILKSAMFGIMLSLILILILALVLSILKMGESSINYVNQFIKIVSILLSERQLSKMIDSKYILKGAIVGGVYSLLSYSIFSILSGKFLLKISILTDLLFSLIIGIICILIWRWASKRK